MAQMCELAKGQFSLPQVTLHPPTNLPTILSVFSLAITHEANR